MARISSYSSNDETRIALKRVCWLEWKLAFVLAHRVQVCYRLNVHEARYNARPGTESRWIRN